MRLAIVLLTLFMASSALAESSEDARKELSTTLSDIKQSDEKQKTLEQKTEKLQAELKRLQEAMAAMGKDMLAQEEALAAAEDKLAILEEQKKEKAQALAARQDELAAMVSAMVKLKALPPEAVIAMPGKLDETLATARALSVVTQTIADEAQSLKAQLRELDLLEEKIRHSEEAIAARKETLSKRREELTLKMKERGALVESLGGEEREEKERVAHLTAKSKNLQQLVESLQKSESSWTARKQESHVAERKPDKTSHKLRSFENARGHITLPAAGKIVSHYGNPEASARFAKGIVIETHSSADVVAPFDGEVVFAGPFRDYGSMVIIRHAGEYHTLLSGMDVINCSPGQYLLEGEPIGSMGSSSRKLYMELREDGKPVDPADWVKG